MTARNRRLVYVMRLVSIPEKISKSLKERFKKEKKNEI